MATRKKKMSETMFAPIPQGQKKEWDALVKKGRACVASRDKSQWQLIALFGQIETKYGEGRVERFADEIGIDKRTGYTYRKLFTMGVTSEFVTEWSSLGYTMVREILFHTGKVANPATEYFLEYAREHKMTVRGMQSYMMDSAARDRNKEHVEDEMKVALASKQEMEGFPDVVRYELERVSEEHPHLNEVILQTVIMDADDVKELKIRAGVMTDHEQVVVDKGERVLRKVKNLARWLTDNKELIAIQVAYGHEFSEEIRFNVERIRTVAKEIADTTPRTIDPADFTGEIIDVTAIVKEPVVG